MYWVCLDNIILAEDLKSELVKLRSGGITKDSSKTPLCSNSLQEAIQIMVYKHKWGVYFAQPMYLKTILKPQRFVCPKRGIPS